MTGEQLREELERIATRAPAVAVPDDLFARGRRATMRARVLAGAAAVACLALVALVSVPLLGSDDTEVADRDEPRGVPDVIYGPPLGERSLDLTTTPLEEVEPAAVAYQVEDADGHVMLITPEGDYRAVLLPDRYVPMLDETTPVLSPDGRQLAYASQHDLVRGLSVLDLTTGDIRQVTLGADPGALVSSLQWSPDSRWIVWSGQRVKQARENGASYRSGGVAGIIAPGATRSRALSDFTQDRSRGPGVCNDGTPIEKLGRRSWQVLTAEHGGCVPPSAYFRHPGPRHYRLLGWLPGEPDDSGAVAVVQIDHARLVLAWPGGRREQVGRVEAAWTHSLTVATGLMSAEEPTVPAGPDPWRRPWIVENWMELLALLAIAAFTGWTVLRVRRAVRG